MIETKSLGIFNLVPKRLDRLELMNSLSNEGKSTSEIRDHLNSLGYLKIRTNTPYSIKDVSMGILKYRRRLKRKSHSKILRVREQLVVVPLRFTTNKGSEEWRRPTKTKQTDFITKQFDLLHQWFGYWCWNFRYCFVEKDEEI